MSHSTKTGHFGDVLPSQSLGLLLKKQQKQPTHEQNGRITQKSNLNLKKT